MYDGRCRRLQAEEERALARSGRVPSLRFRVEARTVEFEDLVRGRMSFEGRKIGDFVILRSEGIAPYNFAVVIDDAGMEISHVIRGEDHLANTARQILLYRALGFPPPRFAHLSLILGPDRSPLSKRHGATAVSHFREAGYLPEALVNSLALLGWSSEDGEEVFSLPELVAKFSLGRISRGPAVFDREKLNWVNRTHLKGLPGDEALDRALPFLRRSGMNPDGIPRPRLRAALETVREEADTLVGLAERLRFFFDEGWTLTKEAEDLLAREESRRVVRALEEELRSVEEVTPENTRAVLSRLSRRAGVSGRGFFLPLRAILTGETRGPELEKVFVLLGKEKIMKRADSILQRIGPERSPESE